MAKMQVPYTPERQALIQTAERFGSLSCVCVCEREREREGGGGRGRGREGGRGRGKREIERFFFHSVSRNFHVFNI